MSSELKEVDHHKQYNLCSTRPAYRQGRNLTAVKVYTVTSESQHLFIYGVPCINLRSELKSLFNKYGQILNIHVVSDHKVEIFTECYHIQYDRIASARIAKKLLDNKSFYGGVLHVCYAPECETLEETLIKLQNREKDVMKRVNKCTAKIESTSVISKKIESSTVSNSMFEVPNQNSYLDLIQPIYKPTDPVLRSNKKLKTDNFRNLQSFENRETSQTVSMSSDNENMYLSENSSTSHQVNKPSTSHQVNKHNSQFSKSVNVPERIIFKPGLGIIVNSAITNNSTDLEAAPQVHLNTVQQKNEGGQEKKIVRKVPSQPEKRIVFRKPKENLFCD